MTRRGCRSRPPSPSSLRSPSRALPNSAGSAPAAAPREQRPNRTRPSVPASQVGRPRLVNRIHPHEAEIKGATMPAHHHRRRTALVPALTAVAGLVALALAGPAYATYPGHNGRIAFQSATAQGIQIFTVRPNGRDLRQTTHVSGDAIGPDWSPDGRLIAFDIEIADSGQIAIVKADGTGLGTLPAAPGHLREVAPTFTPHRRRPDSN